MPFKLTLPDLGEGVVEAEVMRWFVAPGEAVTEDQPLVEVMTDKATVTIPSPRRGRVARLCCQVGEVARVHAPLVELEPDGEADVPGPGGATAAQAPAVPAVEGAARKALAAPAVRAMARSMGVDIQGVQGSGKGGRVTKEDLAAAVPANGGLRPENGRARAHQLPVAEDGERGGLGGRPVGPPGEDGERGGRRMSLPQSERGDWGGRPVGPPSKREERIPLRGLRKRIAEHMARSTRTAAHFTFVEQADVTELVRLKHRMADAARAEGVRVTYLSFIVKAVVAALKKHPELNATLDEERNELVLKRWYDIGIATATDEGLLVPVIRGADRLSLVEVAREITRVARDAKAGRSRPEDVGHSTFTVTSLGGLGGLFGTPVLNYPEVGIMGVHRIRPTPVVRDGQIVIRDVLHLSMTGDHRVVDGQSIAAFTYQVVKFLEDPGLMFMQMV